MKRLGRFDLLAGFCVVAGAALVAENHGWLGPVHRLWPVFPAVAGGGLVAAGLGDRRAEIGMLGAGVYLLQASALFLVLNYTSWWLLAEWWPLFVGFLGVSFIAVAFRVSRRRVFAFVGSLLIAVALTFFFVFSIDAKLWPISLILFGLSLLIGRMSNDRASCPHR